MESNTLANCNSGKIYTISDLCESVIEKVVCSENSFLANIDNLNTLKEFESVVGFVIEKKVKDYINSEIN